MKKTDNGIKTHWPLDHDLAIDFIMQVYEGPQDVEITYTGPEDDVPVSVWNPDTGWTPYKGDKK